jgi:hypothetical protein
MCPMADMYELRDRPQRGNLEEMARENLLEEESICRTENVCRGEESIFDTSREIKELETIPGKIAILHTKKESIILKAEEHPRKPWYFAHV